MPSIAAGQVNQALGSNVPCQSNSSRKRERSMRVSLAPCEIESGLMSAWRSRRTCRKAAPFGAHIHLWPLPV